MKICQKSESDLIKVIAKTISEFISDKKFHARKDCMKQWVEGISIYYYVKSFLVITP